MQKNIIGFACFIFVISMTCSAYSASWEKSGEPLFMADKRPVVRERRDHIHDSNLNGVSGRVVSPSSNNNSSNTSTKMTIDQMDSTVVDALNTGRILLNFDNVDIKSVTRIMSDITRRTIIPDRNVNGNITILSSRKVTIGEAWNLYISALEASGYGVIENNGVYRIVDLPSYRKENTRYVGTGRIKPKSGYVVAIVLLSNADSELMKSSLQPLVVAPGIISSYDPSNALIITDTSENVSRITKIAKQLDEKYKGSSIKIFQPKHIRVKELAAALTEVYQANAASAKSKQQVKISAYEPTNTLKRDSYILMPMSGLL